MSVLLDADTRVLVQGITGQQARVHVEYMLDYGTQVVAGVSPRKGGQDVLGIPVFGSVREALAKHPADLSVLFVPGPPVWVRWPPSPSSTLRTGSSASI